jgi:hypothetical protein
MSVQIRITVSSCFFSDLLSAREEQREAPQYSFFKIELQDLFDNTTRDNKF